jgi:broad specificity phosphatase PhoE
LQTTQLAFAPFIEKVVPVIKERLRERFGVHTCDQRSSKTWITSAFPGFRLEDGFMEDDKLWQADRRETFDEHVKRKTNLLIDLFENDENQTIALVAHSGAMMALFGATGCGKIPVKAGAVYPLLVRATRTVIAE